MPFSNKPWSDFSESDYSPEQWKAACLIHFGNSDPPAKDEHKLPVKEPGGALNRNGIHAAAAILAGARGGVEAAADAKRQAAKKLIALYKEMGDSPPDSLYRIAGVNKPATQGLDPKGFQNP